MLTQAFQSSAAKVLKGNVISLTHPPSLLPVPHVLLAVLKHTVVKEHSLADHLHLSEVSAPSWGLVCRFSCLDLPLIWVFSWEIPQKLVSLNSLFISAYYFWNIVWNRWNTLSPLLIPFCSSVTGRCRSNDVLAVLWTQKSSFQRARGSVFVCMLYADSYHLCNTWSGRCWSNCAVSPWTCSLGGLDHGHSWSF